MSLIKELKRRNVFRVAAAYVVTAWLVIQVVETILPAFGFGDAAIRNVTIAFAIGLLPVLILAWAFELTPDGLKKERDVDRTQALAPQAGKKLDRMIMLMLALGMAYFAFDKFVITPNRQAEELASATQEARQEGRIEALAQPAISEKSIAVLPFINISSDPEQEYFSDGLTEELLNLLTDVDELKVSARTSSFFYKDKLKDIPFAEIGQQLGVAYLLEGSVRKGGDQVRITAQLIKASDGFHLWSETWDRKLDDVFAIQDEISASVVESLKLTILGGALHATVIDTESWELTLRGRFLFNRRAEGDLQRALELFQQAVEIDPNNAAAWVGMSPLYLWLFDPPREDDTMMALDRALALEPDNPEALGRRARALGRKISGPTVEWVESWRRAIDAGMDNQLVLGMMAGGMHIAGDFEGVIEFQQRALDLDPLQPVNVSNFSAYLFEAGRFDEAERWALKAREISPEADMALGTLIGVSLMKGDLQAAETGLKKLEATSNVNSREYPVDEPLLLRAMLAHSLGDTETADALLEQYEQQRGGSFGPGMAYLHTWRGEADKAWEWLERIRERSPDSWEVLRYLNLPYLYPLHDDPRWAELTDHYRSILWPEMLELQEYARNKLGD
jgi:TolB-like protein/Flp pilus assembly protein TadD